MADYPFNLEAFHDVVNTIKAINEQCKAQLFVEFVATDIPSLYRPHFEAMDELIPQVPSSYGEDKEQALDAIEVGYALYLKWRTSCAKAAKKAEGTYARCGNVIYVNFSYHH